MTYYSPTYHQRTLTRQIGRNTLFIAHWNVVGAFVNPDDITNDS